MIDDDESLFNCIIWSNKAMFKRNGYVNRHSRVYLDSAIPHDIIQKEVNTHRVIVCAGIMSDGISGAILLIIIPYYT